MFVGHVKESLKKGWWHLQVGFFTLFIRFSAANKEMYLL